MTITDYLINAVFVFFVLRQVRERRVDLRSLLVPLTIVFFVARNYVHSIPTTGNDLVLVAALASVGLILGISGGFATRVRRAADGDVLARVRWVAGGLLIAGISARMIFVFAVTNGAGPAVRSFSIAHHIGAAAWPLALVAMALVEVVARQGMVHLRAYRLRHAAALTSVPAPAHA
ncbi:MAG TPA: hypothetical protein VKR21_00600 [Solirubrobacteraceae bacterium]|nr:hypothetical protein [Solirubrobacteraceae bacterium]